MPQTRAMTLMMSTTTGQYRSDEKMFYYKRVEADTIVSVEAKSFDSVSPGFEPTTQVEYDEYIASLPVVEPEPV